MALEGCHVSSRSPSRVLEGDKGVVGTNVRELFLPEKGSLICPPSKLLIFIFYQQSGSPNIVLLAPHRSEPSISPAQGKTAFLLHPKHYSAMIHRHLQKKRTAIKYYIQCYILYSLSHFLYIQQQYCNSKSPILFYGQSSVQGGGQMIPWGPTYISIVLYFPLVIFRGRK